MNDLRFDVVNWIPSTYGEVEVRQSTGSLRIIAGQDLNIPITEVEDTVAQTVRSHINVPLVSMATWLLVNWWRLRWEQKPDKVGSDWRKVHSLAGIGGDNPWPALEFANDGDSIRLTMKAENRSDVAAIRYLRNVDLEVPAETFEMAVDRFVDTVEARLGTLCPNYRVLAELRTELAEERESPHLANLCRWQALAGIDPGEASDEWLAEVEALVHEVGPMAGDELVSVLPDVQGGLPSVVQCIDLMKASSTTIDLSWINPEVSPGGREPPWQRGVHLAMEMRKRHGLGDGPLSDKVLSDLLSVKLPLPSTVPPLKGSPLSGGFRNGVTRGHTRIVWPSVYPYNQRFFLAKMLGAASFLPLDEHVIPLTGRKSVLQKVSRSFAQEFLCPWEALDAFTDEYGNDDDALVRAAEYFQVSEHLVRTTLVNRGKMARDLLP